MNEVETKVREVLAALPTLFLATTHEDEPWVAGGFFAESDPFTLVMVLESRGTTLRNIKANPRVAVVVRETRSPPSSGPGRRQPGDGSERGAGGQGGAPGQGAADRAAPRRPP